MIINDIYFLKQFAKLRFFYETTKFFLWNNIFSFSNTIFQN